MNSPPRPPNTLLKPTIKKRPQSPLIKSSHHPPLPRPVISPPYLWNFREERVHSGAPYAGAVVGVDVDYVHLYLGVGEEQGFSDGLG